jgi:hypothetical protein
MLLARVSDGSGALFKSRFFAGLKKAGTYSTTRSFYGGARHNQNIINYLPLFSMYNFSKIRAA